MKFSKEDVGVFVEGATLYNPTEQSFQVLRFAMSQGFEYDFPEDTNTDDWSYDEFEDLGWAVEEAIAYLNTECCDDDVAFTFVDTDFVLVDLDFQAEGW